MRLMASIMISFFSIKEINARVQSILRDVRNSKCIVIEQFFIMSHIIVFFVIVQFSTFLHTYLCINRQVKNNKKKK